MLWRCARIPVRSLMSFRGFKDVIAEGDLVVAYANMDVMSAVTVKRGDVYNNKFGSFKHINMVGKKFGAKMSCTKGTGWIYLLHPTPELWTMVLPHRTQILYAADISALVGPSGRVTAAGTGSGSLSHAIARTIAPSGHLHTFEFHEQRADLARKEFVAHGLGDIITVSCTDACSQTGPGFGLKGVADAVFLDLPQPWLALSTATTALKAGGRLCSFSPCIEQVQRMCDAMRAGGFPDVRTVECLERSFDLSATVLAEPRLGPGPPVNERKRKADGDAEGDYAKPQTVARQQIETRGHTGYLTVGTFVPPPAPSAAAPAAEAPAVAASSATGDAAPAAAELAS